MPFVRFLVYGLAKTLSKVFGLATMSFFGRLPSRDDDKIALVGLLSLSWLPIVLAVAIPAVGETIFPFAPDDEGVIRAIAAVLAVAVPLAVGVLVSRVHNNVDRPPGRRLAQVASGLWYVPVIGLVVVALILIVPVVKASHIVRRFDVQRLLVMIPAGSYEQTLEHACRTLRDRGIEVEVREANPLVRVLFRLLGFVLQEIFRRDVADDMRLLRGHDADGGWFEITVHAADISIIGRQRQTCRLHALLAEELDERILYFTWDDASQALEGRMRVQRERLALGEEVDVTEVQQLAEDLAGLELGKEEWNSVRRNLLRLERDVYRARAGEDERAAATRAEVRGRDAPRAGDGAT